MLPLPSFKFMVHDKWSNVLFLHWQIPAESELQYLLEESTAPFILDQYNGSIWIGLVLLTEHNVGPSFLRSPLTCVTHHGVNVRTYVRGVNGNDDHTTSGIHFSSLECDMEFTAFGANLFGMPYRVATIHRTFGLSPDFGGREYGNRTNKITMEQLDDFQSCASRDELACSGVMKDHELRTFRMLSTRSTASYPSLLNIFRRLISGSVKKLHGTELKRLTESSSDEESKTYEEILEETGGEQDTFQVKCQWRRSPREKRSWNDSQFANWLLERYFVYTQKYGINWRGQVEHEPWPVEDAILENLQIQNVEKYEPVKMQPILRFMASRPPDSVLFSSGVGPIAFNMLRPV
jgi:uncharacterized protein YqjF (DUF2071 family)